MNTNDGGLYFGDETLSDSRRREIERYAARWDVELFRTEESFRQVSHSLTTSLAPLGGAKIDLFVGAMYVPAKAGCILALHELGHLLLSNSLGHPRKHDEDRELACFEYYSVLWLGWPIANWKAWRSKTGTPRDGDLAEKKAKTASVQEKLLATGLFERESRTMLIPTFKSFRPHPALDHRVGALLLWMG